MDNYSGNNIPYNNPGENGVYPPSEPQAAPNGFREPYMNKAANVSPSSVYNSTPRGAEPQYHYGINQPIIDAEYIDARRRYHLKRQLHSKKIKTLGSISGLGLLILLFLSNIAGVAFLNGTVNYLYNNSFIFSHAFYIFYSVITIGFTFVAVNWFLSKASLKSEIYFDAPEDKKKALFLIAVGFGGCIGANFITSILRTFAEGFGIYSDYSAIDYPETVADIVIMFVATALIPALIEEFAFRGVLLGSLKKYGNAFAIIASSFVFAVFHGNAVQIPFAFMCGLFLGYAVLATKSIWSGVLIHALTNSISCVSSVLISFKGEELANSFYMILTVIGMAAGVLCLFFYISEYKSEKILSCEDSCNELDLKTKLLKFISSPVMIIAVIIFIATAIRTLSSTPTTY